MNRVIYPIHAFVGAAIIIALGAAAVTAARDNVPTSTDGFAYIREIIATADVVVFGILVLAAVFALMSVVFGALTTARGTGRRR
jgi:hypothetical protein